MNAELEDLGRRLIGAWTTESEHPLMPDLVIIGTSETEWFEGEQLLIHRTAYDHPEVPDALTVIGDTDGLHMHYFDTRGVYRLFDVEVTEHGWTIERGLPADEGGFAQRMAYTFTEGDRTMVGRGQLSYDGQTWDDDMVSTYRRT